MCEQDTVSWARDRTLQALFQPLQSIRFKAGQTETTNYISNYLIRIEVTAEKEKQSPVRGGFGSTS